MRIWVEGRSEPRRHRPRKAATAPASGIAWSRYAKISRSRCSGSASKPDPPTLLAAAGAGLRIAAASAISGAADLLLLPAAATFVGTIALLNPRYR